MMKSGGYFDPEFLQAELSKVNNELNDERVWSDVNKSKNLSIKKTKLEKSSNQLKELQQAYRARELEVDFMFNKIKDFNFSLQKKITGFEEKLFPKEEKDEDDKKDEKETQNVKLTVTE